MRPSGSHAQSAILRAIAAISNLANHDREKPILIVEEVRSTDWASATFIGATHDLDLRIDGEAAAVANAAARIVADLPECDIALCGHIVAEIVVLPGQTHVIHDHMVSKALTVNALVIRD